MVEKILEKKEGAKVNVKPTMQVKLTDLNSSKPQVKQIQQVKQVQQNNNKQPQNNQNKQPQQNSQKPQNQQKPQQNQNKQPQKQFPKQAVSIQSEIRRLVKEEISKTKR